MGIEVTVNLQSVHCIRQDRGSDGSAPYIWPATVWINTATANVIAIAPAPSQARVILRNGMHDGDTASIPSTVGSLTRRFDDDLSKYTLIVTVILWEKRDLSDDAIAGGFAVYSNALQTAIAANLLGLASTDPTTHQHAVDAVKNSVNQQVQDAIRSRLTDVELVEIKTHVLTPDSVIDNSSTTVSTASESSFQITFGNTPNNQSNNYTIDAALQLKPVTCEKELNAVPQDEGLIASLEAQLRKLQKQLASASVSEKPAIRQDIDDLEENQIDPAKTKLQKDTAALNACRAQA